MIAECANDLYTKVQAIPALSASSGLAVGGQSPDPGMTKVPLPAAWILAHSAKTNIPANNPVPFRVANVDMSYLVMLYVPYLGQSDLINNQLPLLQSVIKAVHGTDAPSGQRWRFDTYALGLVNTDRLGYKIQFVLDSAYL